MVTSTTFRSNRNFEFVMHCMTFLWNEFEKKEFCFNNYAGISFCYCFVLQHKPFAAQLQTDSILVIVNLVPKLKLALALKHPLKSTSQVLKVKFPMSVQSLNCFLNKVFLNLQVLLIHLLMNKDIHSCLDMSFPRAAIP